MISSTDAPPVKQAREGLSLRHVLLVAVYSVRFTVRTGGGLVFIFLFLFAGIVVAGIFIDPVDSMLQKDDIRQGRTTGEVWEEILTSPEVGRVVQFVTGGDDDQTRYLLREKPALLSAIFMIQLLFIPFFACVGSFNQTAGDIGSRGLRYLLLRTERPNIYIGRFLASVGTASISVIVLVLMIVLYVHLKLRVYPFGDLVGWGAQGFLAMLLLALPYIALCAFLSGMLSNAFLSLFLTLVSVWVPLFMLAMVKMTLQGMAGIEVPWLMKVLPWGWKYDLLHGDPGTRITAYAVLLGFSALFFLLGLFFFKRRDL